ncbi:MAG: hypothetical protein A2287_07810 [Candidatus Melainabacteria bacterium RIFOXYA12_FULL_32_12]|nr:MAG: hypothetical protein A2255_02745 [Candidatus Melainabacteria bacterium RIFOXYA2_FULL_32_9]OGI29921.1 MAG: hypothetical protein A2287_07810 [Candidatus Melainabacteria bacterium RIFOXYA12_FULL_32_12]
MVVQFELGSKHLENKKQANAAITEIQADNTKNIVKELINKSFGYQPSEKAAYDDYLGLTISIEEIAKVAPEAASVLVDQILAQELTTKYGNGELNSSEIYATLCAEPGVANLKDLTTKATNNGGNWHIEGKKLVRKEHLTADKYLIFAQDENNQIRVFNVSEKNINIINVTKNIAGSNIELNKVEINIDVPESACVAVVNDNFESYLSIARTLIAAVAIGIGHSSIVAGISTAKEVRDTNNMALSGTQSVQFTLADMYAELEAARMLTYFSADLIDNNKANIKYATMAKVQATDTASQNSIQALQMLGNLGYLANNDFADVIRLAVDGQIKGGTNRVQRNQIYQHMLAKK